MCKLLECNEFWHFIFFYLTNMIWKKSCAVYSLVFMIERFFQRIELDMTVFAVQSGFAYPLLLISLRHSKWIFKPPLDVIFTGLSWSWTARELRKWCKSNIRECDFFSLYICTEFACLQVVYSDCSRIIYGTNMRRIPEISPFTPSSHSTMGCSLMQMTICGIKQFFQLCHISF